MPGKPVRYGSMPKRVRQMPQTARQMPQTVRQMPQTVRQMPQTARQMPQAARQMPQTGTSSQERIVKDQETIIKARERRVAEARSLNLLSNTFMTVALDDKLACQHVLRVVLGIADLEVREVRKQYRLAKVTSHDAILDILAEDGNKKLYNIETINEQI